MKEKPKNINLIIIIIFVILFLFPFLIPPVVLGGFVYVFYKIGKSKNNNAKAQTGNYNAHGDERFDHHEDECISCDRAFDDEDEDNDCVFCQNDRYSDNAYEEDEQKEQEQKDFDLNETLEELGKSITDFAKSVKDEYNSSSIKPNVEKASQWLKEEITINEKDDEEEASAYFGTYDDVKEEEAGLRSLLKAGVIEKDEYEERLRELKKRS